jgi:lipoate-protein ligase A
VVVDLEVDNGRIADFHLAGDFFLEPDDARWPTSTPPSPGFPWRRMPRASRPSRGALPEGAAARFTPESVGGRASCRW